MLFPGAAVVASDLDTFMTGLEGRKDQLPVVTGELADGWIYGAPSATTNRRLSPSRPIRLNQSPYYQAIVALTIHMGLGILAPGIASDPIKLQRMRELARARAAWTASGAAGTHPTEVERFTLMSMKNSEHVSRPTR